MLGVELEGLLDALGELEVIGFARSIGAQGIVTQRFGQRGTGAFVVREALAQLRKLGLCAGAFAGALAACGIQFLRGDLAAQARGVRAPALPAAGQWYRRADDVAAEGCVAIEGLVEAATLQARGPLAALQFPFGLGHERALFHGEQKWIATSTGIGRACSAQQFIGDRCCAVEGTGPALHFGLVGQQIGLCLAQAHLHLLCAALRAGLLQPTGLAKFETLGRERRHGRIRAVELLQHAHLFQTHGPLQVGPARALLHKGGCTQLLAFRQSQALLQVG